MPSYRAAACIVERVRAAGSVIRSGNERCHELRSALPVRRPPSSLSFVFASFTSRLRMNCTRGTQLRGTRYSRVACFHDGAYSRTSTTIDHSHVEDGKSPGRKSRGFQVPKSRTFPKSRPRDLRYRLDESSLSIATSSVRVASICRDFDDPS